MKKWLNILWLLASFAIFTGVSYARDRSSITIRIRSSIATSKDTPAEILLTDPQNRRTGYDATAAFNAAAGVAEVHEIPHSNYSVEGIADNTGEGRDEPFYRELWVSEPLPGKYGIQIIGKQAGGYRLSGYFHNTDLTWQENDSLGFVVAGQTIAVNVDYNPVPGAPAPVMTKTVTFDTLRNDVSAARQLSQLGDDKFAHGLIKNIDLAEKLAAVCDKRKREKDKPCEPAANVLKLFVKRLELANHKCDVRNPAPCDEEREWDAFRKEHGKDHDYDDFFRDWNRDDWHKDKKTCKRSVSEEALKIIKDDAGWLIKSLGGEMDKRRDETRGDDKKGR